MSSTNFQDAASATSSATGDYSVTFQTVRLGYIWTGSVQIPSAVPASVLPVKFTAFDSGIPIGSWYNDQSSPNLQVQQQLSVTASGLTNSTRFQAFFKGMITPAAETPPFWPGPTPAPPPSAPRVIVSNNVALGAGATVQIGTDQPVIVGTGLEIFEAATAHQGAGSNVRLYIRWSVDGSFVNPIEWTMDLSDAVNMRGLILPHLAPFVRFLAISGGQEQISLTVVTGLPPIVRPPLILGGDLTRYNATIADGGDSGEITLPPYVGDAQLFLTAEVAGASPAAGAIFARLTSQDYLGVSSELARVGATTQFLAGAGTTSLQPGYIWKMSPRINSIRVFNRIGGGVAVTVSMAISVSGP